LGSGDGALNQGDVIRTSHRGARGLQEVGDLKLTRHGQQFILAVQEA
jgi:hypothetical protein